MLITLLEGVACWIRVGHRSVKIVGSKCSARSGLSVLKGTSCYEKFLLTFNMLIHSTLPVLSLEMPAIRMSLEMPTAVDITD